LAKLRRRDVKNALLAPWSLKTNTANDVRETSAVIATALYTRKPKMSLLTFNAGVSGFPFIHKRMQMQ